MKASIWEDEDNARLVLASINFTGFLAGFKPKYNGKYYFDGGFSNKQPVLDEETTIR